MSHLLYASNEMFSSTHLIRKSKEIFDKLLSKKIDKAVILRDGKPNFMLLEFSKYEKIMTEYIMLKEMMNKKKSKDIESKKHIAIPNEIQQIANDDINETELKNALEQIDALEIVDTKEDLSNKSSAQIKEFWN